MGFSKNSKREVHSNIGLLQQTRKYLEKQPKLPTKRSFPGGSDDKESTYSECDLGSIPGLGRSVGGKHDSTLQYSCLENPHGQRSLAGYSPWSHKELDVTEVTARTHGYDTTETVFSQICEISSVPEMVEYASTSMTASSEHFR